MGFVGQRFLKEIFVSFYYGWIFMGETKRILLIQLVQISSTYIGQFHAIRDWLSTTADTSARTCHHFHKMIFGFTGLDALHQFSCIAKSTDNRRFDLNACDFNLCFFDSLHTTYYFEQIRIRILAI